VVVVGVVVRGEVLVIVETVVVEVVVGLVVVVVVVVVVGVVVVVVGVVVVVVACVVVVTGALVPVVTSVGRLHPNNQHKISVIRCCFPPFAFWRSAKTFLNSSTEIVPSLRTGKFIGFFTSC
jgi:hypothetical protein